jgi:hypothetical protein
MAENKSQNDGQRWWDLNPEELKQRYGYEDFTKKNALRIAYRDWSNLDKCIQRSANEGLPPVYEVLGYLLTPVRITQAEDLAQVVDAKPNAILVFALQEQFCGKKVVRYEEGQAPLILKLPPNKLLVRAIRLALTENSEETKELKLKPLLIEFFGFKPHIIGVKPYQAGAIKNAPKLTELPIFGRIRKFLNALKEANLDLAEENKLIVVSQKDFDEAYKKAFGDLLKDENGDDMDFLVSNGYY